MLDVEPMGMGAAPAIRPNTDRHQTKTLGEKRNAEVLGVGRRVDGVHRKSVMDTAGNTDLACRGCTPLGCPRSRVAAHGGRAMGHETVAGTCFPPAGLAGRFDSRCDGLRAGIAESSGLGRTFIVVDRRDNGRPWPTARHPFPATINSVCGFSDGVDHA
jgi:hypothetical protein